MAKSIKAPEAKVAISRKKIGGAIPLIVNEITDKCLYSGFFGTLDSARMKSITDKILDIVSVSNIDIIIIDLSNVDIIDSAVATYLTRLGDTLILVGMKVIFCGIQSAIAQTMITSGIDMKTFKTTRNIKAAMKEVFVLQGLKLIPMSLKEQIAE